ncbi:MAG: hypothetical protein ACX93N_13730 [Pseudohaliea sp.]
MKTLIHRTAAGLAALMIIAFLASTLISELFLSLHAVAAVKQTILFALIGFIPLLMVTAGTGFALGKGRSGALVKAKRRRMPLIALNGMLVLVPLAFYLNYKAQASAFDSWFYFAQILELIAGAGNLTLIFLNMRDGMRMKRPRLKMTT